MNCRFIKLLLIASLFTCAHASAQANQCNDGIDNDGDGKVDGLREIALTNGIAVRIGGAGDPNAITQAVANAIRTKKLPLTIPLSNGAQILRADHPIRGRHSDEGGTLHLPTLTKVCNILGYRTYVSSTCRSDGGSGRCNYYSPGDNYMWRFVNGNFSLESATYKTWVASITCRDALSACSDGLDNDSDGRVDRADPDCLSDLDNSELPKDPECLAPGATTEGFQCSNGLDDDGDGAIDFPADFSCTTAQDNDETNTKSQCQDGVDNDNDGSTDTSDPGCQSLQDNDESDEVQKLTLGTECVVDNTDGSHTGYFSYNNLTAEDLSVPIGFPVDFGDDVQELPCSPSSPGTVLKCSNFYTGPSVNEFSPGPRYLGQPSKFLKGMQKGVVRINFTTPSITWTVRPRGARKATASATSSTPRCAPLEPLAECRGFESGTLRVKVGYKNSNPFTLKLPIGEMNQFTPGQGDRGQPDEFFAGLNKGVFNLDLANENDQSVWRLNGVSSALASTLPICEGECVDTPTGTITGQLNAVAIKLADAASDAADLLAAVPATRGEVRQATKQKSKRQVRTTDSKDRRDAERSRQAALEYERRSKELILEIPAVIKNCPEAPAFCTTVDRGPTIDALRVLYAESRNSVKRVVARAYFRATGHTYTSDPIVTRALRLEAQGNAELDKLPRFATECK